MAIVRVPIVLNRNATLGGLDVDVTISPVVDEDGYLKLACSKCIWMQFKTTLCSNHIRNRLINQFHYCCATMLRGDNTNDESS